MFGAPMEFAKEAFACESCLASMWEQNIVDFLIARRDQLGFVDNRRVCWYGRNCRTQNHNADHAARLSHLCNEVPQESRRNTAPPRQPQQANTGGVRGISIPVLPVGAMQPISPILAAAAAAVMRSPSPGLPSSGAPDGASDTGDNPH